MKEMVGGCCVCSDERGWPENPLVYCDGQNCTVAVHQACYGIVTVPTGPWYCRKCESQERSARVRCELCPSRDGALKKTDNQGWAHVVCALYIPEVRFGNVTTMEPIILQLIPPERYSKTCYICQEIGKGSKAHIGACMQCNKSGCKQQFHVTCAQTLGLLCEEAGNYLDNVKYCGYCQHHYSKLKKGGNVKTIPPYKPVTNEAGSSDSPSSPEKDSETIPSNQHTTASTSGSMKFVPHLPNISSNTPTISSSKQRKSSGNSKSSNVMTSQIASIGGGGGNSINSMASSSSSSTTSSAATGGSNASGSGTGGNSSSSKNIATSAKDKEKHSKHVNKVTNSNKGHDKESKDKASKSSKGGSKDLSNMDQSLASTSAPATSGSSTIITNAKDMTAAMMKESLGQKFTTSNFTETIVVNSESVFGSDNVKASTSSTTMVTVAKKRKADSGKSSANTSSEDITKDLIKDVSVTLVPLPLDRNDIIDDKVLKKQKTTTSETTSSPLHIANEPNLQNVSPNLPLQQANVPGHKQLQQQQQQVITSSTLAMHSPLNSKNVSSNEAKLQTPASSYSASSSVGNLTAIMPPATPSLVVSVPLSTATLPGINLPTNTNVSAVTHIQNANIQKIGEQMNSSSVQRASPITSSSFQSQSQHNFSVQPTPISQSQPQSNIERHSPLILANSALSPSTSQQMPASLNSPNSGVSVLRTASPASLIGNIHNISGTPTVTPLESGGGIKITYEKQPNNRVAQLQDEAPTRRSSKKRFGASSSSPPVATPITNQFVDTNQVVVNANSNINIGTLSTSVTATTSSSSSTITTSNKSKAKKSRTSSADETPPPPPSTSRTPDQPQYNTTNSFGGLKFTYESQTTTTAITASVTPSVTPQPQIKDSPPSSPGSEAGSRKRKSTDTKDFKIFQNGIHATHMLGNQLNPASSVAQKMSDQLHMELEAHSVYTSSSLDSSTQLIGPPFPGKQQSQKTSVNSSQSQGAASLTSMLGGNGTASATGNTPQSLEQLLERQWEQGSQFLMEQAQHFDIASLLSCLHQLRTENIRLEEHVTNLVARRDHLLAVNARLAIPLNPPVQNQPQGPFNNVHINGPMEPINASSRSSRPTSGNFNPQQQQQQQQQQHQQHQQQHQSQPTQSQQQLPVENGIDFRHSSHSGSNTNSSSVRQSTSAVPFTNQGHSSIVNRQQQPSVVLTNNPVDQSRGRSSYVAPSSTYTAVHTQGQGRREDSQGKPS